MKNSITFYFYWYLEWKRAYLQIWAESRYDESWWKVDWHRMWCISSRSGSRRWWSDRLWRVLFPNGLCQQKIAMSGSIKRTCFIWFSSAGIVMEDIWPLGHRCTILLFPPWKMDAEIYQTNCHICRTRPHFIRFTDKTIPSRPQFGSLFNPDPFFPL